MRPAIKTFAAAVTAGCMLGGCSTFLDLLEGQPSAAETPGVNLLRNPGFETFKGNAETTYLHDDAKASSRGVAADWVVCPGSQVIITSIAQEAAEGKFSQRVDVQAVRPDRQTPHVAFTQSQAKLRLKGATQYELAAWVKGRGVASLSVVLNDDESRALGSKVVLTDTWQHVQMAFATPKRVRNIRELIRFGEDGDAIDSGGVADGDWMLIDGFSLRASVPRLGSLDPEAISSIAERRAAGVTPGAKVIAAALTLVRSGTVVKGGCWDWVNRAFSDAGYMAKKRRTVFQSKPEGPYVDIALIEPGDWISFKNLTYGEIGHSALFVDWIDFDRFSAITLEYAGENREIPGRYREYDIFKCYLVTRPVD